MRGKRTPPAKAAEAVGLAVMVGTAEASQITGIPERTIRRLRDDPEMAELGRERKEAVAEAAWAAFQVGLHRAVELFPKTEDIAKVSVALGVIFDKYALLTGQATARTETRDVDIAGDSQSDLGAARGAYLTLVSPRPGAVGGGTGNGAHANGTGEVPAADLPGLHPGRREPKAPRAEGSANGHQPDGGYRGEVAG